jgi:hypothetical protein
MSEVEVDLIYASQLEKGVTTFDPKVHLYKWLEKILEEPIDQPE